MGCRVPVFSTSAHKILNNPLPSWYEMEPKADFSSRDIKADSKDHYLTFTVYDDAVLGVVPSNQTKTYQPVHKEGNFFWYPPDVTLNEGYNRAGLLDAVKSAVRTKGIETS